MNTTRFQLRRWPTDCPPLVGELAVVDTQHMDRIVMTYRDETCMERGGAIAAAMQDIDRWNSAQPTLVPIYFPRRVETNKLPDGTVGFYQVPNDDEYGAYDLMDKQSLYRDFKYHGL